MRLLGAFPQARVCGTVVAEHVFKRGYRQLYSQRNPGSSHLTGDKTTSVSVHLEKKFYLKLSIIDTVLIKVCYCHSTNLVGLLNLFFLLNRLICLCFHEGIVPNKPTKIAVFDLLHQNSAAIL